MVKQLTNGQILAAHAERAGIPLRTLEQVRDTLVQCKRQKSDATMARLMLKAGRLTDDARAWIAENYPQD
jgi:hypothetical protein